MFVDRWSSRLRNINGFNITDINISNEIAIIQSEIIRGIISKKYLFKQKNKINNHIQLLIK